MGLGLVSALGLGFWGASRLGFGPGVVCGTSEIGAGRRCAAIKSSTKANKIRMVGSIAAFLKVGVFDDRSLSHECASYRENKPVYTVISPLICQAGCAVGVEAKRGRSCDTSQRSPFVTPDQTISVPVAWDLG